MTRRLPTTLTDYVFWLINPALIMLLLDSFTFYLLEAHYDGGHKLRLLWAFAFYNMGIVACARISLIEGASAAEYLSVLLIGATFFVVLRLSGSPFAFVLIFVIALLAFRLAKNTTILDDRDEASAMGLVGRIFAGSTKKQRDARAQRAAATSDAHASAQATIEAENEGPATPLARLMASIRGKEVDETPGLWILYLTPFTLMAMGLSSWFLPPESRTYAHLLLALHLGCALILLATATFLNLRRYLRHRMIQMPERMSGVWVASSALMLVGVLLAAMILPRPGLVEPLRSELFAAGDDWLDPSDWALPWDGTKGDADSNASGGEQDAEKKNGSGDQAAEEPATGNASGSGDPAENGEGGGAPGGKSPGERAEGSGESGSQGESSGSATSGTEGGQSSGDQSNGQQPDPSEQQSAAGSQSDPSSGESDASGERSSSGEPSSPQPSPQGESVAPPAEKGDPVYEALRQYGEAQQEQQDRFLQTVTWEKFFLTLRFLVMFAIWLFALAGAAYLVWRFRDLIFEAFEAWWTQMREWFARVLRWGDPTAVAADGSPIVATAPPRPFAAYADPFRTGAAAQWNLRDLLAYSLEALDAWSRERQFPRGQGETPGEFASRLALREPATHATVVPFANVYAQAAFAPDGPPQNTIDVVRGLWNYLAMSTGNFGGPAGAAPPPGSPAMRPTAAPPLPPRQ